MKQASSRRSLQTGTLPQFHGLIRNCSEIVTKGFASLLQSMMDNIDIIRKGLADKAATDSLRAEFGEAIQEIQLRRLIIEQSFSSSISESFHHFEIGSTLNSNVGVADIDPQTLALIDKDDHDIAIAMANIVSQTHANFTDALYQLNQRLAVLNDGIKIGELSSAFPGGPKQICDAFYQALGTSKLHPQINIELLKSFLEFVMNKAGSVYDEFNTMLMRAGVLPHLKFDAVSRPSIDTDRATSFRSGSTASHDTSMPAINNHDPELGSMSETESLELEVFYGITQILARHRRRLVETKKGTAFRQINSSSPSAEVTSSLTSLLRELNELQQTNIADVLNDSTNRSSGTIKYNHEKHAVKLSDIFGHQSMSSADVDMIDLVGMLFDFILNDKNLPDTVKALLSHLHTPYLKVAILDKKFFIRSQHPARKLLDALSQAGTLYSTKGTDSTSVLSKMQYIVNKIIQEFNSDFGLFPKLLDEFTTFIKNYNRRIQIMEKRAVEAVKGKEKLKAARQAVSEEIISRIVDHPIPKVVEDLLLGPWANFLTITYLRSDANNDEWKSALKVTDDLVWSAKPKQSEAEREQLWVKLPMIISSIQAGLELAGDQEVDHHTILQNLEACHKKILTTELLKNPSSQDSNPTLQHDSREMKSNSISSPSVEKTNESTGIGTNIDSPSVSFEQEISEGLRKAESVFQKPSLGERIDALRSKMPKEFTITDSENNIHPQSQANTTLKSNELIKKLRNIDIGTWFEFLGKDEETRVRGKVAWINTTTYSYLFVNQEGRQISTKSIFEIADEMGQGFANIIKIEKLPLMDRALRAIHGILKQVEPSNK